MKAHHSGHNVSVETVTLSGFVEEQDALNGLGLREATPKLGARGGDRGVNMVIIESVISVSY